MSEVKSWMTENNYHHHHQSLNREGRWGTTDDFATSFLHFSLFSTALLDLPNSRPVHSLMLCSSEDKLQPNDEKTEALLVTSRRVSIADSVPTSLRVGLSHIKFASQVLKKLGVTIDCCFVFYFAPACHQCLRICLHRIV